MGENRIFGNIFGLFFFVFRFLMGTIIFAFVVLPAREDAERGKKTENIKIGRCILLSVFKRMVFWEKKFCGEW